MKLFLILLINIKLIILNSPAIAGEREGFGLSIERGSYKPKYEASEKDMQTSSLYGFSLDYQWIISQSFSFSIMGVEHGGESDLPPNSEYGYYKSGFLGAGIKVWIGSFFIGIHGGEYYLTWIEKMTLNSNFTTIVHNSGSGFGVGMETVSGIIIAIFNEKSEVLKFDSMLNQKVDGNRILLGYRW